MEKYFIRFKSVEKGEESEIFNLDFSLGYGFSANKLMRQLEKDLKMRKNLVTINITDIISITHLTYK